MMTDYFCCKFPGTEFGADSLVRLFVHVLFVALKFNSFLSVVSTSLVPLVLQLHFRLFLT